MITRLPQRLHRPLTLPAVALAFAATMLPAGRELPAQTPPPPKVFYACYIKVVGAVYRIKEPNLLQNCATGHVPFSWTDGVAGSDHGLLVGLLDDDHPQYLRTDGTRTLTGDLSVGGFKLSNLAAASANGEAVRFEQAVKSGDAAGGDLSGTFPNANVAKLQGTDVAATAPTSGQVLTFNGTAWAPATGGGGGVSDHGSLTGLTDDDHPQYLLADGVRAATNGFAVAGTPSTGAIPTSGIGARLMWYPGKIAFRAGEALGTEWDDANVGAGSIALGVQTKASGNNSTALGWGTTASGIFSTALGDRTTASGNRSTAFGLTTTASGFVSTAMGDASTASGIASTALGTHTVASGNISTAMGYYASTNGHLGAFVYSDAAPATALLAIADNEFAVRASGGFRFRTAGDLSTGCDPPAGSGVFSCTSSRLTKEHFTPLDAEGVLGKIAGLSIQSWNYKAESAHARHAGPIAEDFYSAFRLGTDSTAIGTIDEAGISMIAIQALEARTAGLKRENEALRAALTRLEKVVRRLGGSR